MKNPNNYGTITKLSGNRRRPWIVKEGQSGLKKIIGYAETKAQAIQLLSDYNRLNWNIDAQKITLKELYALWQQKRAQKMAKSSLKNLHYAYSNFLPDHLKNKQYRDIKSYLMQDCIDSCGKSYAVQAHIKAVFTHLDKLARELDIIQAGYSDLLTVTGKPSTSRSIFTAEEVARLWQYPDKAELPLFLLYSGWRISEALNLKLDDISLDQGVMQGGIKTQAGKNRIVPIHPRIMPMVAKMAEGKQGSDKLVINTKFYDYHQWGALMDNFKMDHCPHECRHTFRSWLDSAGANKVAIDRLMGHTSGSVGERVYTHKTLDELRQTIALIA